MTFLLALDVGTTSVKAGLFQADGVCLATALQEYALISNSADQAELDPNTYWMAACQTIRQVVAQSNINPANVTGLAVSSQGETTIALDSNGVPLRNALVWLDNRAGKQSEQLKAVLGEEVYERTGIPDVVATWPACKILWIKENEPQIFAKAAKFVLVQDFLVQRMCGQYVTDGSISCTTLFYNIITHNWWPKALQAVGIDASQLPQLLAVGTTAGNLTPSAAAELGLTVQTKVVLGGMDQAVGAIGAGNIGAGVISETTGAALAIQASILDPLVDKSKQTPVYVHSVPAVYLFVPVCPTAGMAFKWFKDQFGAEEIARAEREHTNVYELLNHLAEAVPAGSDGLVMLPHLMGAFSPESNPAARGVFSGFTLHHGRGHFVRAIQEGVAFMLRRNLELIESSGVEIKEVRTTGGGSRGKLWNQIKADVCNRPFVTLENEDTALVGDAILAGVACGTFTSVSEGVKAMVRIQTKILPGENVAAYEKAYKRYCALDNNLSDYFKQNY
ncbi:MAG: FGGY family carbohydrate kinase [Anaerolineaceae bacterium]|nr:FGGY family carbohydrate kinase [Anaerolineaceae bacterium]